MEHKQDETYIKQDHLPAVFVPIVVKMLDVKEREREVC